jgi:hypothetical protein
VLFRSCWLNREDARKIVDRHSAYVDCGNAEPRDREERSETDGNWLSEVESWEEAMDELEGQLVADIVPIVDALAQVVKPSEKQEENDGEDQ